VPANTTAGIAMPASDFSTALSCGQPLGKPPGVKFIGMKGASSAVFEVGSGDYSFETNYKRFHKLIFCKSFITCTLQMIM
jgi:hypothetical protein